MRLFNTCQDGPSRFVVFAAYRFCRWKRGSFKAEFSTAAIANLSKAGQGPKQLSFTTVHSLLPGGLRYSACEKIKNF